MVPGGQQLPGPTNMNMSSPAAASIDDSRQGFGIPPGGAQQDQIVASYLFPQEKENIPYRIKIPLEQQQGFGQGYNTSVTLRKVKEHMPKKGANYRFFFKSNIDGDICFEEETNDNILVPTIDGKIVIECRNE
jgi:hypothetical protein